MSTFEEHVLARIGAAFDGLERHRVADAYAISFYLRSQDDDPRRCEARVTFNTERRVRDCVAGRARAAWIEDLGLAHTDAEFERDFERCLALGRKIERRFEEICVRVARELHAQGAIERAMGRPLAVLVHDLEYAPRWAKLTARANPGSLAQDFIRWVEALGD